VGGLVFSVLDAVASPLCFDGRQKSARFRYMDKKSNRCSITRFTLRVLTLIIVFAIGFLLGRQRPSSSPISKAETKTVSGLHRTDRLVNAAKTKPIHLDRTTAANASAEQTALALLQTQLNDLRKLVAHDETLRNRIIDRGGANLLGLGLDHDFIVGEDLAEFMQLSKAQTEQLNKHSVLLIESIKTWEAAQAQVAEEEPGKMLSYKLPVADATLLNLLSEYTDDLKLTVGQSNYDMIKGQVEGMVADFNRQRQVTYYTIPDEEGGISYQFTVEWMDPADGSSGSYDETAATLTDIPFRWQHLFNLSKR